MNIFETFLLAGEFNRLLRSNGVSWSYSRYIDLYKEYTGLKMQGEKVSYIVELLAEQHSVSVRQIYKIIKVMEKEVNK